MRKILALILALAILLAMGTALAADPIAVKITPLDYQTGKAVDKTYVENELFRLRVDIDIPRFADLTDMQAVIEVDGAEVEAQDVMLADGAYYITGIVTDQPAALTVKIKDMAYEYADTAEELYNAMQEDRTVSDTYYFYSTTTENRNIIIPKTGDASIIIPVITILACAGLCLGKRR